MVLLHRVKETMAIKDAEMYKGDRMGFNFRLYGEVMPALRDALSGQNVTGDPENMARIRPLVMEAGRVLSKSQERSAAESKLLEALRDFKREFLDEQVEDAAA